MECKRNTSKKRRKKSNCKNNKGITLLALIITIIVLVILAGVAINMLYGENGIISNAQDVATLSNIKSLEEAIDLYKIDKNIEGKVEEESYPIALNEDGSWITLSQMRNASELAKLPDEVKYTLLNLTTEKGTTNIPSLDNIDYGKFYKLDYTKLNISKEEAENLVIYIEGDTYKVINLAGVKYRKNDIYVIIPLNNEADPEYITAANNTYKLYGNGTLKALGEKTTNSGYDWNEINAINNSWDEFDLKAINAKFDNRMNLPNDLTSDWYASHVYFSTGTVYVIDNNNDLWAWGANDYNKLGLGNSFLVVEPTKILEGRCEGKENVKASKVWAGVNNTFIVDTEGNLWGCGANKKGVLGQGNTNSYNKWVQINYINGNDIKDVKFPSMLTSQRCLIIMKEGTVYCAGTSNGEIGETNFVYNSFVEIPEYKNAKQICLSEGSSWLLKEDGTLYGCGYGPIFSKNNNVEIKNAIKIAENVKQINEYYNLLIYQTEDNKLYYRKYGGEIVEINLEGNENTVLLGNVCILNNGKMYSVNLTTGQVGNSILADNLIPYENNYDGYSFRYNPDIILCKNLEGKIYVKAQPNITLKKEKANYTMRTVFENAIFVQGKGSYISIVDRNGKIYESTASSANLEISDAKKIVSSSTAKYVIKNDGTLWAKGNGNTGMWGEDVEKDKYIQITTDGTNVLQNVKNVFCSANGRYAIILTDDSEIYWAGNMDYGMLPKQSYDITTNAGQRITKYPKKIESNMLNQIKNKIKDIQCCMVSGGGIWARNTLILTEDGDLYTMSDNINMSGNGIVSNFTTGDFSKLPIKEGTTVKQVLTEEGLCLVLLSTGEVYGWGYNTYGILGPKYEVGGIYPTPVKLEGLPANIRYMSLGNGFAIFASKSGEVYGIGKNDYGQLGTGDSTGRTEFVRCTKLKE